MQRKNKGKLKEKYANQIKLFVSTTGGKNTEKNVDRLSDYFLLNTMYFLTVGFGLGSVSMFLLYSMMLMIAKSMGLV